MGRKNVHYKGIYLMGLGDIDLSNGYMHAGETEALVAAEYKA